jgi:hypothetical protein
MQRSVRPGGDFGPASQRPAGPSTVTHRMKRTLLLVGAFLVALLGALWFLGVFESDRTEAPTVPADRPAPETPAPTLGTAPVTEPAVTPPAEVPDVASPIRVLILAEAQRSFFAWCTQAWEIRHGIRWQTWYAKPPLPGTVTSSGGLAALDHAPTAADLDGYDVLFLAATNPAHYPEDFWVRVAELVRDGRLGLLVIPDHTTGFALGNEPSLLTVLPVTGVLPLKPAAPGTAAAPATIPGVFETSRPFAVTADGTKHPASRFVSFPGWSERIWGDNTRGEHAWGTKFVSPVTGTAPDATVLLQVDAGEKKWPAFVATSGAHGRALWLGGILDLDWDAYRTNAGYDYLRAMAISWLAWLSPPR